MIIILQTNEKNCFKIFLIPNSFYKEKDGNNKYHKLRKKMKHFDFVIYNRKCKIV
jgi:hypothetical protein